MNCPCSLALKHLVGVKRVQNGGLIHVDDITWIFPRKLCLHEFDEVLGLLFGLLEGLLCSVSSFTVGYPDTLGEASDGQVLHDDGLAPEVWEQATCLLANHVRIELNAALPCLEDITRKILLDHRQ